MPHHDEMDETPPLTTSLTRSAAHLHYPLFAFSSFTLCALRTAIQQPLNLALVRQQGSAAGSATSVARILQQVYRGEGGARALLRGMPALTMGCGLSEVVYLTVLEYGRCKVPLSSEASRTAVAGYGGDALCRLIHTPLSIIAYRQMMNTCPPSLASSALRTAKGMYAERGCRTLFAGLGTTLLVGCQWSALWWPLYHQSKTVLYGVCTPYLLRKAAEEQQQQSRHSTWWSALPAAVTDPYDNLVVSAAASAFTSATTAVIFNPFLVLRTNLQLLPSATLLGTARYLYQSGGCRAFYRGLSLSITTCVVDGALASISYEYAKLWSDVTRLPSPSVSSVPLISSD